MLNLIEVTKVVNINKDHYDILIDRTTIWGNPWSHRGGTKAKYVVSTREEAIKKYEEYLMNCPMLLKLLPNLKGKTLGCHCKPKSCHGDILVKYIRLTC